MLRRRFLCASLGLGAAAAGGWGMLRQSGALRIHAAADLAFGTLVSIRLIHHDARQAGLALEDALAAARTVDTLMSVYRRGSQVYELNHAGRLDRPSPHLVAVLSEARRISALTDGAFDITVQPLWELARQGRGRAPALPLVGWRRMRADAACVTLHPGMQITLNGIAQGYAVDLARAALQARGLRHALIDTGEFSALGAAEGGRPWTLAVRDPRREDVHAGMLQMDGRAVATSGDYASAFTPDFSDHHIFDPATGASPFQLAAVTVTAPSGILADGLSTAFMVMGAQRSLALAAGMKGVDLVATDKQGRRWLSPGLRLS
ncbi:MAG: FAD:protein FMN transferase [Noviherbaspirillum sp.]